MSFINKGFQTAQLILSMQNEENNMILTFMLMLLIYHKACFLNKKMFI